MSCCPIRCCRKHLCDIWFPHFDKCSYTSTVSKNHATNGSINHPPELSLFQAFRITAFR